MKFVLKTLRILLPAVVLASSMGSIVWGKAEYSKKEGVACTACHTKAGSKDLNDVGKCYQKSKSLKECKEAKEAK